MPWQLFAPPPFSGESSSILIRYTSPDWVQSQPIHGFWDKDVSSHCISGDNILVIPGSINAVLDAFVMALVSVPDERGECGHQ